MHEEEDLVPEDDSVFNGILNESLVIDSDALLDDSFASMLASTPAKAKSKGKASASEEPSTPEPSQPQSPRRTSARLVLRSSSPSPVEAMSSSQAPSPRRTSARLALRSSSPSPAQVSSPQASSSRSASPKPTSKSSSSRLLTKAAPTQGRIKCRECPSTFANDRTYAVHKKLHSFKRAFSKMASEDELMVQLPKLFISALERMLQEPTIGKTAMELDNFVKSLKDTFNDTDHLHDEFFKFVLGNVFPIVSDTSALFSSSISFQFYTGVNRLLNAADFRKEFKNHIRSIDVAVETSDNVLNMFMGSCMLHLSTEIIIFTLQRIHGSTANDIIRRKRSEDSVDSETFLQLVYHVGGSVVSGFLFKGEKYKANNANWGVFVDILKNKFIRGKAIGNECADDVSAFTSSKDRGGLKHISQEALDFFVVLFDEIMSLEGEDGSLPVNVVDENILGNSSIICLWDVLVGCDLEDDVSLHFLIRMAESCKLIIMKGIMKRRLNEHHKRAYSSMALRSRLAK